MKITDVFLCSQEEFDLAKTRELIPLSCITCNKTYHRVKRYIVNHVRDRNTYPTTCSKDCKSISITTVMCCQCNKEFEKQNSLIKENTRDFCTSSCAATFNNKNKTHGTRRSKLEKYLEDELNKSHPNLSILYSSKTIIGSELDIYIPSLKLAFEVQGIFHYEPIFGQEKLDQIQKNDLEKVKKCKEIGIKLIQIDTRSQKSFSIKSSKQFLEQINSLLHYHCAT